MYNVPKDSLGMLLNASSPGALSAEIYSDSYDAQKRNF